MLEAFKQTIYLAVATLPRTGCLLLSIVTAVLLGWSAAVIKGFAGSQISWVFTLVFANGKVVVRIVLVVVRDLIHILIHLPQYHQFTKKQGEYQHTAMWWCKVDWP